MQLTVDTEIKDVPIKNSFNADDPADMGVAKYRIVIDDDDQTDLGVQRIVLSRSYPPPPVVREHYEVPSKPGEKYDTVVEALIAAGHQVVGV